MKFKFINWLVYKIFWCRIFAILLLGLVVVIMKKIFLLVLVFLFLIANSVFAASNGMIKRQIVNGIYPDMEVEKVINILGNPKLIEKNKWYPDEFATMYYDNGLTVEIVKRKEQKVKPGFESVMRYVKGGVFVKRIIVKSSKIAFDSGLKVGLNEAEVLNIYGDTPQKRMNIDNMPEYYSYKMMWDRKTYLLTIDFDAYGRVNRITYDW